MPSLFLRVGGLEIVDLNSLNISTNLSTGLGVGCETRSLPAVDGYRLNAGIDLLLARATCRFGWNLVDGLWEGHLFCETQALMGFAQALMGYVGVTVWSYFFRVHSIANLKGSFRTLDLLSFAGVAVAQSGNIRNDRNVTHWKLNL